MKARSGLLSVICLLVITSGIGCGGKDDDEKTQVGSSAPADTWTSLTVSNAPDSRIAHTAVWTGTEMLIWGGSNTTGTLNTGARYNPSLNTWTPTITTGAPSAMAGHIAVWNGHEMIVWGDGQGSRYNPAIDAWQAIISGSASFRADSAAWLGTQLLLWYGPGISGKIFDPFLDIWQPVTTANAPSTRRYYSSVWTGTELIIWGGTPSSGSEPLNTGACYNPALNIWKSITTTNAPSVRWYHSAAWTGREMIVWGGCGGVYEEFALKSGARYDPLLDKWTPITTTNAPSARTRHVATWTGTEMLIWGGRNTWSDGLNSGGRYDPATDTWTETTTVGALSGRAQASIAGTDAGIIIWGGSVGISQYYQTGATYTYPQTIPYWTATTPTNAPAARKYHTAIWAAINATPTYISELIIWGGKDATGNFDDGFRYQSLLDTWTVITPGDPYKPSARRGHTAVWTGNEMIIWGGFSGDAERDLPSSTINALNTGARYNPVLDAWTPMTDTDPDIPEARGFHSAVWTGTELVIWGGISNGTALDTGARYNPLLNDWTTITPAGAPISRYGHTAIWTGNRMIIWGGRTEDFYAERADGAQYDPVSDTWTATTISSEPPARWDHTAVWTGSTMIIWGGYRTGTLFGSGAKYYPISDTWITLSTDDAPESRHYHTAVWTGTEMIIWGGYDGSKVLKTGSRYLPSSNSWLTVSATNAPVSREDHIATWTGQEMIIWGGYGSSQYLDTGGRYKPR